MIKVRFFVLLNIISEYFWLLFLDFFRFFNLLCNMKNSLWIFYVLIGNYKRINLYIVRFLFIVLGKLFVEWILLILFWYF